MRPATGCSHRKQVPASLNTAPIKVHAADGLTGKALAFQTADSCLDLRHSQGREEAVKRRGTLHVEIAVPSETVWQEAALERSSPLPSTAIPHQA